jgi:hypothetical protein
LITPWNASCGPLASGLLPATCKTETAYDTGRTIRFVTNRKIAVGEAYWNTQSQSFNLTAGEINVNDQEKSQSNGVLYPAAQLVINKDGELEFNLNQNPWRLANVIEWNRPSGGE